MIQYGDYKSLIQACDAQLSGIKNTQNDASINNIKSANFYKQFNYILTNLFSEETSRKTRSLVVEISLELSTTFSAIC